MDSCNWVRSAVDQYVDGLLSDDEAIRLTEHCAACEFCAVEIELARTIRDGLQDLTMIRCPDRVTDRVFEEIGRDYAVLRAEQPVMMRLLTPVWRPASVAAAAVAVFFMLFTVTMNTDQAESPQITETTTPSATPDLDTAAPTQAEIDQALIKAKLALAYVTEAGKMAGDRVRSELGRHIVQPVYDAIIESI